MRGIFHEVHTGIQTRMRREVQKGHPHRPSARRQASGDLLALPDGLGQGVRGLRRRGAHAQKREQGMDPGGEAPPRREGHRRELNARGREERPHTIRDAPPMGEKASRNGPRASRSPTARSGRRTYPPRWTCSGPASSPGTSPYRPIPSRRRGCSTRRSRRTRTRRARSSTAARAGNTR